MKYVSIRNPKKVIKRGAGGAKAIRCVYGLHFMPMALYQSCHTVNVSLKLPSCKTTLKSDAKQRGRERTAQS